MRVLVTGTTSLIGRTVAERLVTRGDEVVGFQRRPSAAPVAWPERLGDVADSHAVSEAMTGCDAVIHAAARVGVVGSLDEFHRTNVVGTANVVDACRTHDVRRMVFVSSPSVAHGGEPIVGEGAAPAVTGRAHAHYPETKALAERLALAADDERLGVVAIRPHLVWGPGDTQLVGRIVERARSGRLALVNGGRALVDTTYIDNAADALVAAVDRVGPGADCAGRAYVVSNGEPRPIRELVLGICAAHGLSVTPRSIPLALARPLGSLVERLWPSDQEPPLTRFVAEQLGTAHWFDQRPTRDELGFSPSVSIDEGLRRLADATSCA